VFGGFITPWVIGYLHDRTGDFRAGLEAVAALAIVISALFYLIGRQRQAAVTASAG
jgi:cyanate permease